jgi:hypothetical protein
MASGKALRLSVTDIPADMADAREGLLAGEH